MVVVNHPPPSEWVVRNARPRKDHAAAAAALEPGRKFVDWSITTAWLQSRANPRQEIAPRKPYQGRFRNAKILKGEALKIYLKRNPARSYKEPKSKSKDKKKSLRQLLPRLRKLAVPKKRKSKIPKPKWPKAGVLTHKPSTHLIQLAQPRCYTYCPPQPERRPITEDALTHIDELATARVYTPRFKRQSTRYISLPYNLLHFEPTKRLVLLSKPRAKRQKFVSGDSDCIPDPDCLCPEDYYPSERLLRLAEPKGGAPEYTTRNKKPLEELNCAKCVKGCKCTYTPSERTTTLAVPKGGVPKKPVLPTLDCSKCVEGCFCTFTVSERTTKLSEPRSPVVRYDCRPPEPQTPTDAALCYVASERIEELAKPRKQC